MSQNWINQFGREYEVPEAELHAAGLMDTSWGNDVCPSFAYPGDDDHYLALWIEHPDPERREFGEEWKRYIVIFCEYGGQTAVPGTDYTLSFATDDLGEALAKMKEWKPKMDKLVLEVRRFEWNIGAIREIFPDMPEQNTSGEVVLWDRKHKQAVVTLHAAYGQAFCLETANDDGLSALARWFNGLTEEGMRQEGIPL